MAECSHDCSNCSSNCSERKPESFLKELNPYSSVKKVIAVVSGKGGVGKSLVTSLLASEMQRRGHSCAVLDADITGVDPEVLRHSRARDRHGAVPDPGDHANRSSGHVHQSDP